MRNYPANVPQFLKYPEHKNNTISLTTTLLPPLISFSALNSSPLSILTSKFDACYATTVASILREVETTTSFHLPSAEFDRVLGSLTSSLKLTDNMPTLAYQLLLLTSSLACATENHVAAILNGICKSFDDVSDYSNSDSKYLLATTLSHVMTALRTNRNLAKTSLKVGTGVLTDAISPCKFQRISLFKLCLVLGLASASPNLKDTALSALTDLIIEEVIYRETADQSEWTSHAVMGVLSLSQSASVPSSSSSSSSSPPQSASPPLRMVSIIKDVISFSAGSAAYETVATNLIDLGFVLVDQIKKDAKSPSSKNAALASIGRDILVCIFNKTNDSRSDSNVRRTIVKELTMKSTGRAPNAAEHAKLLNALLDASSIAKLSEFTTELIEWLANLAGGGLPPAAATSSLLPCLYKLLSLNPSPQRLDSATVFTKKALFCADTQRRFAGAAFLVMLSAVTTCYASSDAAEDELYGYIARCLSQQREMRQSIYFTISVVLDHTESKDRLVVAQALSRILLTQIDRIVEAKESSEAAADRRERGKEGGGLSQMSQGVELEDGCPVKMDLLVSNTAGKGGEDEKAASQTLSVALRNCIEPVTALVLTATAVCKTIGDFTEDDGGGSHLNDLDVALINLRDRMSSSKCNSFFATNDENVSSQESNESREHARTVAKAIVLTSLCHSLAVGADVSTSVGAKHNLSLLNLWEEFKEVAIGAIDEGDAAARTAKKNAKKLPAFVIPSERAARALVESIQGEQRFVLENGGIVIGKTFGDSVAKCLSLFGASKLNASQLSSSTSFRRHWILGAVDVLETGKGGDMDRAASSMKLGSLLFAEFAAHSHHKNLTSSATQGGKKGIGVPLAVLSLKGFMLATEHMAGTLKDHALKPFHRVCALVDKSLEIASGIDLNWRLGKDRLAAIEKAGTNDGTFPNYEDRLGSLLSIFTAPLVLDEGQIDDEDEGSPIYYAGGLFAELVANDLEEEASLLAKTVCFAASTLKSDPNVRIVHGANLIKTWNTSNHAFKGPLLLGKGTGFSSLSAKSSLAAVPAAVAVAIELSGGLECDTRLELFDGTTEELLKRRKERGFGCGWSGEYWDAMAEFVADDFPIGTCGRISAEILHKLGAGGNFQGENYLDDFGDEKFRLHCIAFLSSDDGTGSGLLQVAKAIALACDSCLSSADFVCKKISNIASLVPPAHLSKCIDFVGLRLLAVAELVSVLSPVAENVDTMYTFACILLKIMKKIYMINSKIMGFYTAGASEGLRMGRGYNYFLRELSMRSTRMTACLLLTVQDLKTLGLSDSKFVSAATIENHGRVVSNLVFEKERSDAALNKYAIKMKSMKEIRTSEWIKAQIVTVSNRDFRIETDEMDNALIIETAHLKSGPSRKKRKSNSARGSKSKKTKEEKAEEGAQGDAGEEEGDDNDDDGDGYDDDDDDDDDNGEYVEKDGNEVQDVTEEGDY